MASPQGNIEALRYKEGDLEAALGGEWRILLSQAYQWMLFGRLMDTRFLGLQKQGRVGFYGPATGHEAVNVGVALALQEDDWVFPGLREQLVALVRGMDLGSYVHHLFGDAADPALGRQMPCHPTAKGVHHVSMASVVGTQIIQAAGSAYAQKLKGGKGITVGFFGDGATSTGDFHAGMNFAGAFSLPVLYLCANNQWAISVPVSRQTAVRTLAEKAKAYGFPGQQIDGTDVVQVHATVKEVRKRIFSGGGPELVEAVVYRMNPHTSSDDPTRYIPDAWMKEARSRDPLARLEELLQRLGVLSEEKREAMRQEIEAKMRRAISDAEVTPPPSPETLFRDTTRETLWPLTEQRNNFDRDQGGHFP